MRVELRPYCEVDGVRTMSDTEVMRLWEKLEEGGLPKTFEASAYFRDSRDWLLEMRSGRSLLYTVHADGEMCGCLWLNHFQERFCQYHFFFYRGWRKKTVYIGREVLWQVLNWAHPDGRYVLDMLIGISRADNQVTAALADECGMVEVGRMPHGMYDHGTGQSVPAIIYYTTREDVRRN